MFEKKDKFKEGYNAGLIAFKTAILSVPMRKREKKAMEESLDFMLEMLIRR